MTEKDLKKLNRYQLLELLVMQTERADNLQKQVEELEQYHLNLSNLGSMAEASLQIAGVFEAAQKAADLYLESARKQADEIVESARKQAALILAQTGEKAESITTSPNGSANEMDSLATGSEM